MATLQRIWRGEESLPRTYWLYGVVVNGLIISLAGTLIVAQLASPPLMLLYILFTLASSVFILVAVWRSAGHYLGPKVWAILARVVCVLGALRLIKELIDLGSL